MLILIKDLGMQYPKPTSKAKVRYGLYKCDCGNEKIIQTPMVNNGRSTSCGCKVIALGKLLGLSRRKHYDIGTRLYRIWQGMLTRVSNPNAINAEYYYDKGICIEPSWKKWDEFKIWAIDNGYTDKLTIDRKDSTLGYTPTNCRWITMSDQMANKGISIVNTSGYKGVTKKGSKWEARIQYKGMRTSCGLFDTAIEAASAYNTYCDLHNLPHSRNNI
jgi:hypothetical protein